MNTDKYQHQHHEILSEITTLREYVKQGIEENADSVSSSLVRISAKIKLHLAAEDNYVYPKLLASDDSSVSSTARAFQSEMGEIAGVYGEFAKRWCTQERIAADPEGFKDHANAVFKALHLRIQQEEKYLYPLAAAS